MKIRLASGNSIPYPGCPVITNNTQKEDKNYDDGTEYFK